jgi:hypothetical protein
MNTKWSGKDQLLGKLDLLVLRILVCGEMRYHTCYVARIDCRIAAHDRGARRG